MAPGKPSYENSLMLDSIALIWVASDEHLPSPEYQVRYKEVKSNSKWQLHPKFTKECRITVNNLKSGSKYIFQVRMRNDEDEGTWSISSNEINTQVSAASPIECDMNFINDVSSVRIQKIRFIEDSHARNTTDKIKKLIIGANNTGTYKEKTILILGSTGAGKSTLVDAMVNFVLGVTWQDPFRLTVESPETDEMDNKKDPALSQTSWITCYTVNSTLRSRLDYRLNIIDTPGYGHVKGFLHDKSITEQIHKFFVSCEQHGIQYVNAVCIVVRSSDVRLTQTQKYIFSSVLSIFQKDIAENICVMLTFADGSLPLVLASLKKANLPSKQYFKFNNSALFINNDETSDCDARALVDWNMLQTNLHAFFAKLEHLTPKSLVQSREVLDTRKKIELAVDRMYKEIKAGLRKIEEIYKEKNIIQMHSKEIEENKTFKYKVERTTSVKSHSNIMNMNCNHCEKTCHLNCYLAKGVFMRMCDVMSDKQCMICKCHLNQHEREQCTYDFQTLQIEMIYSDLKKKYEEACQSKLSTEDMVQKLMNDLKSEQHKVLLLLKDIVENKKKINEIALRTDSLSVVDHYDHWIAEEKHIAANGWEDRKSQLIEMRTQALNIQIVKTVCIDYQNKWEKCLE